MTSKMSRNGTRININLFADYIEWKTLTHLQEDFFHCPAFVICLRILQRGDCVLLFHRWRSRMHYKADYIFQRRLSSLSLAVKISTVKFWNVLSGENQSPAMVESYAWIKPFEEPLQSCPASFQSRGFKKLVHVKWRSCSMCNWQNSLYPFEASVQNKVSKPGAKW